MLKKFIFQKKSTTLNIEFLKKIIENKNFDIKINKTKLTNW